MILRKTAIKVLELFCFFIVFIIIQVPTLAETFWPNETLTNFSMTKHVVELIVSSLFAFGLVCYFYGKVNTCSAFTKRITIRNMGIAIVLALLSQSAQSFISIWTNDKSSNADLVQILHTNLSPVLLVTLIVVSPILEELLFQGVFQGGILKGIYPLVQILLTAALFAFLHGYSISLDTLELFCSGVAYASVYVLTGDLKMAILSHSVSNLIVTILVII